MREQKNSGKSVVTVPSPCGHNYASPVFDGFCFFEELEGSDVLSHSRNYSPAGAPLPVFTPLRSQQCSATCRGKELASAVPTKSYLLEIIQKENQIPSTYVVATRTFVITAEGVTSPIGVMGQRAR